MNLENTQDMPWQIIAQNLLSHEINKIQARFNVIRIKKA
jgi:hypothetical protein